MQNCFQFYLMELDLAKQLYTLSFALKLSCLENNHHPITYSCCHTFPLYFIFIRLHFQLNSSLILWADFILPSFYLISNFLAKIRERDTLYLLKAMTCFVVQKWNKAACRRRLLARIATFAPWPNKVAYKMIRKLFDKLFGENRSINQNSYYCCYICLPKQNSLVVPILLPSASVHVDDGPVTTFPYQLHFSFSPASIYLLLLLWASILRKFNLSGYLLYRSSFCKVEIKKHFNLIIKSLACFLIKIAL